MKQVLIIFTLLFLAMLTLTSCGKFRVGVLPPLNTVNPNDPYIIVDRSQLIVAGNITDKQARIHQLRWNVFPSAFAYTGLIAPNANISAITYNNPATTVGFSLDVTGLISGSFTGDILSFGSFSINGLNDNKLKVCPVSGEANNGSVKCNKAKIRIYSTSGSVDGVFQNTTDGYYIPLLVDGNTVGVGVANAAYVQSYTIASNKNRLRVSDLVGQVANFPLTMDFSNGGAGSYSATLIVEYVLIKE